VDAKMETTPRPRLTSARWLLALVALVCVLALIQGVWLSWSRTPSEGRSVSLSSRPDHPLARSVPPQGASDANVNPSGRMPIRVSIERAHVQVKCASDGRVPIAILAQCHRLDAVHGSVASPGVG